MSLADTARAFWSHWQALVSGRPSIIGTGSVVVPPSYLGSGAVVSPPNAGGPVVRVVPAAKHEISFHRDWFGSARRYEATWEQIHEIWSRFRRENNPYSDRPTTYQEPSGGFARLNGQAVQVRLTGQDPIEVKAQNRSSVPAGDALLVQAWPLSGRCKIFWRSKPTWLHWRSSIRLVTAQTTDTIIRPVAGETVLTVKAHLRFEGTSRAVPTRALQLVEEGLAKIGKVYPYSAWAVAIFGGADPVWWHGSTAAQKWIDAANLKRLD